MIIIGDVHGKVEEYKKIIDNNKEHTSIQLGDFGFKIQHNWFIDNISDHDKHKIIFGNHDYYPYLYEDYSMKNSSVVKYNDKTIMTVRGADSIDAHLRIEGRDLFKEEQVTYEEAIEISESYESVKPDIVISHDCPLFVCKQLFGYGDKTITNQLLNSLFEIHHPELWIFGHHHKSIQQNIDGTKFICLKELEHIII